MKKTIRLTESQLTLLIERIVNEQQVPQNYNQAFQSGKQVGRKVREVGKEVLIKIGTVALVLVFIGPLVVCLINGVIYKIGEAVAKQLIKFLGATKKAVIGASQALTQKTISALNAAKIMVDQGIEAAQQRLAQLKDNSIAILKWVITQFKQFGVAVYAQVLIAAGKISEWSQLLGSWLKQTYGSIASQIGKTWDQAMSFGKEQFQNVKQGASQVYNKAKQLGQAAVNQGARNVGNAAGFVSGIFGEDIVERYYSYSSSSTSGILQEARRYNLRVI